MTRCTLTGDDAEGKAARISFYSDSGAHALTLANAIQAASNASLTTLRGYSQQVVAQAGGQPLNADFPSEQDKLVIILADPTGGVHKFSVPAPIKARFDTNGRTVTYPGGNADVLIGAFIDATAGVKTSDGAAIVKFLRAHRSFRKSRKF